MRLNVSNEAITFCCCDDDYDSLQCKSASMYCGLANGTPYRGDLDHSPPNQTLQNAIAGAVNAKDIKRNR